MQKFVPPLETGPLPLRPIRCAPLGWEQHTTSIEKRPDLRQGYSAPAAARRRRPPARHMSPPAAPHLSSPARRDAARRQLLDLLDSIRGRKALVLEAGFAAPLGLIADALTLKEHGVEV